MKRFRRMLIFHIALVMMMVFAMPAAPPVLGADIALTITGDGVEREVSLTLAELKSMAIAQNAYTALNTWPTKSIYYAQGVVVAELLETAGLKYSATTINFSEAPSSGGSAGYNMTFLLDDLLTERYTFEGEKKAVPAIIATKLGEKDFAGMDEIDMRLVYGQLDAQEQTSAGFVKSVSIITVSCAEVRQHPTPGASVIQIAPDQFSVELNSDNVNAKIYYTTDGSEPTVHSKMYNVSAPHWQPHLNAPFTVSGNTVVKAIAVATGYAYSKVLEFTPLSALGVTSHGDAGMSNFVKTNDYQPGLFEDVDESLWYGFNNQKAVSNAYEYGLMKGSGDAVFNPGGDVTIAEAIAIAARVHSIYFTGSESFTQGALWYQVYVDYAIENGITGINDFTPRDGSPAYTRVATRAEMAYIFSRSLPQNEFNEQNIVGSLPDVDSNTSYYNSIITLYRAGVLTGSDAQGTFYPDRSISRAEAAAIISRVIIPGARTSGKTY